MVGSVAHESLEVAHTIRRKPICFHQFFRRILDRLRNALFRHEHMRTFRYELQRVTVSRYKEGVDPFSAAAYRHGSKNIVRFKARAFDHRDSHIREQFLQ